MPRSPREVVEQVSETVHEQVRDLPIHAARLAMFGVGRTLLLTDRVTRDVRDLRGGEIRPILFRIREDAEKINEVVGSRIPPVGRVMDLVIPVIPKQPEPEPRRRPGRGRVSTPPSAARTPVATPPEIKVGKPAPATAPGARVKPAAAPNPVAEAVEEVVHATPEPSVAPLIEPVAQAELPVPNYDELTHASLRARLRKLSAAEVVRLRAYESAHAARPEIIQMYDNRIAKLKD